MKVLVACEESQRVCISFRERGHEAYSCDLLPCSGGNPEWHIQGNVLSVLEPDFAGWTNFYTQDNLYHAFEGGWDLIIAHPPFTYLTVTGNRWFDVKKYGEKAIERREQRCKAADFFYHFIDLTCKRVAIENPIGIISTVWRKPDQIIHPYMFGDPARKATCLWLKGLPALQPTNIVDPEIIRYKNGKGTDNPWHMNTIKLPKEERQRERSKTFWGIARAMAEQWG